MVTEPISLNSFVNTNSPKSIFIYLFKKFGFWSFWNIKFMSFIEYLSISFCFNSVLYIFCFSKTLIWNKFILYLFNLFIHLIIISLSFSLIVFFEIISLNFIFSDFKFSLILILELFFSKSFIFWIFCIISFFKCRLSNFSVGFISDDSNLFIFSHNILFISSKFSIFTNFLKFISASSKSFFSFSQFPSIGLYNCSICFK